MVNCTLPRNLAGGFFSRNLLGACDFARAEESPGTKSINSSSISCIAGMSPLAADDVEAMVADRQPEGLKIARAMQRFLPK